MRYNIGVLQITLSVGINVVLLASLVFFSINGQAQDSLKTGFLTDAAEEYWPKHLQGEKNDFSQPINHIPIRNDKGFISIGGNFREVYELFDNYLWGMGPQDGNGYFLHRALVHADFRYNKNFRIFAEAQSSLISGRNGGPRPVQDLDKLAIDQVFGEYSFRTDNKDLFSFRFGKQALNYGVGSLLDIRDINVRKSFFGSKFIIEHKNTKIDLFAAEPIANTPGVFDDQIDQSQKIAGIWSTQTFPHQFFRRVDLYYLFLHKDNTVFAQGSGTENRHTVGAALNFVKDRLSGYTEADFQFGKFNTHSIVAWKLTQTFTYQLNNSLWKPAFSIQSAMSSGDHNLQDSSLNTFNPIYPRAVYYGYIDNVGSANIFLVHSKIELQLAKKIKLTPGYYIFWRQSIVDGLYAGSGSYFITSSNDQRRVGSMFDVVLLYVCSNHFSLRGVATYYKRGPFLKDNPSTPDDIRYVGIAASLHL